MVRFLLLLIALCASSISAAEPSLPLSVEQPRRASGYFIGDLLLQRVELQSASSAQSWQPPELESGQRLGQYLYRLSANAVDLQGARWLELRYQIVNAPLGTEIVELPALLLASVSGSEHRLPPWSFTVSSLIPADGSEDALKMLPDRAAIALLKAHDATLLKLALSALFLTLLSWLAWWLWRQAKDARTLPFAEAHKTIKRLSTTDRDSDSQAWVALHRAFNQLAGKTVSTSSVHELLGAAPWLVPLRSSIEGFFVASAQRFYQQPPVHLPVAVVALCRDLLHLEKRQSTSVGKGDSGA